LGYTGFDPRNQTTRLVKGPIFTELLLVDELNRAPSKTQSALLEAMEEGQVTLDGISHALPKHFRVIATQNPREQVGVYSLPESQLDRFAMCISMPNYTQDDFMALMRETDDVRALSQSLRALLRNIAFDQACLQAQRVHVKDPVLAYMLQLVQAIEEELAANLAIRFRKQLLSLAKAHAFLHGRSYMVPDDLKPLLAPSLRHRLITLELTELEDLLARVLSKVPCP
jgi:MoxR-like ATPase